MRSMIGIGESDVPRHPLSGDIDGGVESSPARPMSSGFAAEHRRLCRSEKHEVWAARAGGCGACGIPILSTSVVWKPQLAISTIW
jgi:hypothetical protein